MTSMINPSVSLTDAHRARQSDAKAKSAIVVGSGLAGLTAGYRLRQAGWQVTILESTSRICGRVKTLRKNGYVIDSGPTAVSEGYKTYLGLINELGLNGNLVHSSSIIGLVRDGRLHCLDGDRPISTFLRMKVLSWTDKLRLVLGVLRLFRHARGITLTDVRSHSRYDHESINDFMARYFKGDLLHYIFTPIARTVTLCDPKDTSCLELLSGLVAAKGRLVNVTGSLETLPLALSKHLAIQLNSAVTRIEKQDGKVVVRYQSEGVSDKTMIADACVVTMPFAKASAICETLADSGATLSQHGRAASCFVVHLGYKVRTRQNPYVVAIPEKELPDISAIFLEHNKSPDRAPPGHSLITVYYWTSAVTKLRQWSEQQILEDASRVVEGLMPELSGQQDMHNIVYYERAAHYGSTGYYKAVADFLGCHDVRDPIQAAGDYLSIAGQETAVFWGERAAQNIITSQD